MQFVIRMSPVIHLVSRQTFCITFLFGVTVVPREIEDNAYAKFGGKQGVLWEMYKWRMSGIKVKYR